MSDYVLIQPLLKNVKATRYLIHVPSGLISSDVPSTYIPFEKKSLICMTKAWLALLIFVTVSSCGDFASQVSEFLYVQ